MESSLQSHGLQSSKSQDNEQIRQYFSQTVKPLFSHLIQTVIKAKPENILAFCTKWFKERKGDQEHRLQQNNSDNDDENECFQIVSDQDFECKKQEKLKRARKKRYGLSSEAYGPFSKRNSIKISKGFVKQEHTYMRILFFCMNSFLFKDFTESEVGTLIKMMNKKVTKPNQIVFEEGEYGDSFYFVDEGIFECVQHSVDGPKSLKYFHVGDTFGQICLLHFMKRQASIISHNDGVLYSLDRESYIHFKKMCMIKKRTLYHYTLKKQFLFSSFSEEEIEKVCDVLIEVSYEEGDLVINEGDVGSKFYIIISGILIAFKESQDNVVQCYKQGDAFGEIALIKDTPRQASVKALTRCKIVYMTQQIFKRIFQHVNLEKEVEEKYSNKMSYINKRRAQNIEELIKNKDKFERRLSASSNFHLYM